MKVLFNHKHLPLYFKNITSGSTVIGSCYVLRESKGDIAQIVFYNGKWTIYIDNFPGPKKFFETNFPIKTVIEFQKKMKRIGLNLQLKSYTKIKWKELKAINCWEGYVNGDLAFSVEGTLCVTDLRESRRTSTFVVPKHYKIQSKEEGKTIAFELVNNFNLDKHKENYDKWEAASQKTAKLIADTDKLIKKLQNENQ